MQRTIRMTLTALAGAIGLMATSAYAATPIFGADIQAHITQKIDDTKLVSLTGNTSGRARAEFDQGSLADSYPLDHIQLQLKRSPEQEQVLQDYIRQEHDPASPNYQKWLTAQQFGDMFGPSKTDVATVTQWLAQKGLTVDDVQTSGMVVTFSGTAGQVRAAFHTQMHRYAVDGKQHIANASDPQIPVALSPVVAGIVSLHDFFPHPMLVNRGPVKLNAKTGHWQSVNPDFSFSYSGSEQYDVGPQDFAKIYNVNPTWTAGTRGAGQTVVVIEDSNASATDWQSFRSAFGLSTYAATFSLVHPGSGCTNPGNNGAEGEAALDAEWATATAPDAAIGMASCKDTSTTFGGLIAVQNLINGTNPPAIYSISYGECESENGSTANAAYNAAYQQAVSEGLSVFVSSGDEGAASCDADASYATHGIAVSGFASTPYNVAVGGTDFYDTDLGQNSTYWTTTNGTGLSSALSYIPEIPWNDSCASSLIWHAAGSTSAVTFCNSTAGRNYLTTGSGSGGPSSVYAKPAWQAGVVGINSDGHRDLPDVSLFAANGVWAHALIFCMSDSAQGGVPCTYSNSTDAVYNSAGGTSFASPAFAGIQALINQHKGARQGNPNTRLYALAAAEYGSASAPNSANLSSCNSTNGNTAGSTCVFYDITAGDMDVVCRKGSANCYVGSSTKTYGVLSTSTSSLIQAYGTTQGWDFSTGLGTVNVTNLVNAW
jgi:subtilase family serine protease